MRVSIDMTNGSGVTWLLSADEIVLVGQNGRTLSAAPRRGATTTTLATMAAEADLLIGFEDLRFVAQTFRVG